MMQGIAGRLDRDAVVKRADSQPENDDNPGKRRFSRVTRQLLHPDAEPHSKFPRCFC